MAIAGREGRRLDRFEKEKVSCFPPILLDYPERFALIFDEQGRVVDRTDKGWDLKLRHELETVSP